MRVVSVVLVLALGMALGIPSPAQAQDTMRSVGIGAAIAGAVMTLVEPEQPVQPGTVDLRTYLGPGSYPGHSYRLVRRRGSDYGIYWWHGCGNAFRCSVTVSSLERRLRENYGFGYVDGFDDGIFQGLVGGHRAGWTQGHERGQQSMIEVVDANGLVVYSGPFIPFEERSPTFKYGGVALAVGGVLLAALWPDGPTVNAGPTDGGAFASASFGF